MPPARPCRPSGRLRPSDDYDVVDCCANDEDAGLIRIKISQGDYYIYIRQLKIMFDDACALVRILDMVNPFFEGAQ